MAKESFLLVDIFNISLSQHGFLLFLKNAEREEVLPICVGAAEVNSITAALAEHEFPRPLTHDLIQDMFRASEQKVHKVEINDLKEGTYYSRLYVQNKDGEIKDFDSRPSDSIGLALRYQAPIYVERSIFEKAAVKDKNVKPIVKETSPLSKLREALEQAVKQERFEDALKIRTKIQELEVEDLLNN